jgi:hypothetical protein
LILARTARIGMVFALKFDEFTKVFVSRTTEQVVITKEPIEETLGFLWSRSKVREPRRPTMRPEPIREIAPPAWPLPLIGSLPRGPRRTT